MNIMRIFSRKCKHDWQDVVNVRLRDIISRVPNLKIEQIYPDEEEYVRYTYKGLHYPEHLEIHFGWSNRKVCLLCGECSGTDEQVIAKYTAILEKWYTTESEESERNKLAKRMWEDNGCHT